MLVVAVSALVALAFTIATRQPEAKPPRAAGEAAIRLINAEHDLVAASVEDMLAASAEEDAAEARSRADMRALAEAAQAPPPDAPVAALARHNKPVAVAAVPAAPKPNPLVEARLSLQATSMAGPERRRPASRAGGVFAAVGRIPSWVRVGVENVAEWAVTAPVKTLSRLPERRFL